MNKTRSIAETGLHLLQTRIPDEDWRRLRAIASLRGMSTNSLMLQMIRELFDSDRDIAKTRTA